MRKVFCALGVFLFLNFLILSFFLPVKILAQTGPVLTRSNNTFYLNGITISRFGLRAANALQNDAIADRLISNLPTMRSHGIQSVSISLQGARANDSSYTNINVFNSDGSLKSADMARLNRILDALVQNNMVGVIIFFYQAKDQTLSNDSAVLNAARNVTSALINRRNLWFNVINEPGHSGFDVPILTTFSRHPEIYNAIKSIDPSRIVFVSSYQGANDGFNSYTGTTASNGSVVIEYSRQDAYSNPGVFSSSQITQIQNNAQTTYNNNGYWFWHAAWHQKADVTSFPRFDKGGEGTSASPGVSFIWNKMQELSGGGLSNTPTPTPRPSNTPTIPPKTNTPTSSILNGDANGDGKVDITDYSVWLSNYTKTTSQGKSVGDFNANGIVDGNDFLIWQESYNGP